jgi:hypothetical protein
MPRLLRLAGGCALLLLACRERAGSSVDASSAPPLDAAVAEPPRPALEYRIVATGPDAGAVELPAAPGEKPEIPPVDRISLETNVPLQNYRIRVFDEADRAMVSDDEAEDTDAGVRYRIAFPEPLRTGHAYALVVDSETTPDLVDAYGRTQPDLRLDFRIAGEKEKPPPPPKKRRRR